MIQILRTGISTPRRALGPVRHPSLRWALIGIVALVAALPASRILGQTTLYWNGYQSQFNGAPNNAGPWDYSTLNWEDASGNLTTYNDTDFASGGSAISDPNVVFGNTSQVVPGGMVTYITVDLETTVTPLSVLIQPFVTSAAPYGLASFGTGGEGAPNGTGGIADSPGNHTTLVVDGQGQNSPFAYIILNDSYTGSTSVINGAVLDVESPTSLGNSLSYTSALIVDRKSMIFIDNNTVGGLSDDFRLGDARPAGVSVNDPNSQGSGGGGQIIGSNTAGLTIQLSSGSTYSFSGQISNQSGATAMPVAISGPGTQILAGTVHDGSGAPQSVSFTISNSATLKLGSATALGSTTANAAPSLITLLTHGTLDLAGNSPFIGGLNSTPSGGSPDATGVVGDSASEHGTVTLTIIPGGVSSVYRGTIQDSLSGGSDKIALLVTDNGKGQGGTQTLFTGTDTYSGGTTVAGSALSAGGVTLQLRNAAALGSSSAPLVVSGGGLDLRGSSATVGSLSDGSSSAGTILTSTGSSTLSVGMSGGNSYNYAGLLSNGSGAVALSLSGSGTLALSNSGSNYSGGTTVGGGVTLKVLGATAAGTGHVTVNSSGTLSTSEAIPVTLAGGLTLTGPTSVLFTSFSGPAPGSGSTPLVKVSAGGLSISGTTAITLSGSLQAGTYDLFQFTGTAPSIAGLSVTGPNGFSFAPSLVAGNEIDVAVTVHVSQLTWTGASSRAWNTGDANWTGDATTYADGDAVTFGNTGAGTVTISSPVSPQSVTFSNTAGNNYSVGGAAISGNASLIVNGGGLVTLSGSNSYGSGTVLSNGSTLNINSDAALGTAPLSPQSNLVFNGNGTLQFAASFSGAGALNVNRSISISGGAIATLNNLGNGVTVAGAITGAGGLISTSSTTPGALTLSGTSTYTGATTISNGSLILASGGSLGNTAISVAGGATFAPQTGSGAVSAGSSAAGSAGATLTLNPNSTFNMTDGAIGTFNLQQQASFGPTNTALTINGATLKFEAGSGGIDQLAVGVGNASVSGTNTIGITGVGSSLTPGLYPLISAPAGGLAGTFQFAGGSQTQFLTVGSTQYTIGLNNSATAESARVAYANTLGVRIISDPFRGGNSSSNQTIFGTSPTTPPNTGINLPGGIYLANGTNAAGQSGVVLAGTTQVQLGFNSAALLPISSAGSYTKPAKMTISAGLEVNNDEGTSLAYMGLGLGFYSSSVDVNNGSAVPNFYGVVLNPSLSSLTLSGGTTATPTTLVSIPWPSAMLGMLPSTTIYTVSYSIDTSAANGGISNVTVTNTTTGVSDTADFAPIDNYNGANLFTDSNTGYVAFMNFANNFAGTALVSNFQLSTTIGLQLPSWIGPNSTTWTDVGNWINGVPGATSGTTNTDTAIFNGNPAHVAPVVDLGRNLQNITFTSPNVGAVTLGTTTGNPLLLTAGGTIQTNFDVLNPEVVNAPLVLEGNCTFTSGANSGSATLSFGGGIAPGPTSGTTTLTLNGGNIGANTISGVLADHSAGKLAIFKDDAGTWILTGSNSYTGGTTVNNGTLRFNNMTGTPATVAGAATISNGATLELAGTAAGLSQGVTIVNNSSAVAGLHVTGTNQLAGAITGSGNMVVESGAGLTAYQIVQNSLTINGTGKVALSPSGSGSTTAPALPNNINFSSNVGTLSISGTTDAWTGTLDIGNNGLVIQYGGGADPFATIENMVHSGYANGSWMGTGITSSLARAAVTLGSPTPALNIGLIDFIPNTPGYGSSISFAGQTITTSAIMVRLTYMDDLVLAGDMAQANATSDALFFAANYGSGTTWKVGDVTHDGQINTDDALLFAANYVVGLPSLDGTTGNAAAIGGNGAAVPEPSSTVLATLGALGLGVLARRRRLKTEH